MFSNLKDMESEALKAGVDQFSIVGKLKSKNEYISIKPKSKTANYDASYFLETDGELLIVRAELLRLSKEDEECLGADPDLPREEERANILFSIDNEVG